MAFGSESAAQQKLLKEITVDIDYPGPYLIGLIEEIESSTDFSFMYSKKEMSGKRVRISSGEWNMSELMYIISSQAGISVKRVNEIISLKPLDSGSDGPKVSDNVSLQVEVSGTVTSENGEGLPGATVLEKGTTNGTITDTDGNFRLNVEEGAVLVVSFVGYKSVEYATNNSTVITIVLEEDIESLEEVVVIGYGSVKKSDLTGSIASVNAEDLENIPVASLDQSLVGRAAGVQVNLSSGMPGGIASIRIRGSNSLVGGNEPLYVVDGYPVYSGAGFGETGSDVKYSPLATLNPNDIENIEILKDASATSIYGSRGANGVVLITTKNGRTGQDKVTFESYYGVQSVARRYDMMNALEYATLINEAASNDGTADVDLPYSDAELAAIRDNPEGTDWQDEIFRTAVVQNYQLSFSGGDQKGTYFLSANYWDQEGMVIGSGAKRYSTRLNLRRNVLPNIQIGANLNLSRFAGEASPSRVVRGGLLMNPVQPVFEDEANGIYTFNNSPGSTNLGNPVATALEGIRTSINNRIFGNFYAEWEFLPSLKLKSSYGVDLQDMTIDVFTPGFLQDAVNGTEASSRGREILGWLNENTVTYNKQVDDHSFTILGGLTMQSQTNRNFMAKGVQFVTDKLRVHNLQGAVEKEVESDYKKWSVLSYLSRVNYDFKGKYLLTGALRVDGSSRFGADNKYAVFPSGAFKWRLGEEPFINGIEAISDLGLRVSYGITGNQQFDEYQSIPRLDDNELTLGRQRVIAFGPDNLGNPALKWEKTGQFNAGLDIGVIDNRVRLTADYYKKTTTDLLYELVVPFSTGFEEVLQNIGSVENQGVELSLSTDNVRTSGFSWSSSFNIAFNRNKVLDLGSDDHKFVGQETGYAGFIRRLEVGKPMGLFYGYVSDGLFRSQPEVDAGPSASDTRLGGPRYKDLGGSDGTGPDGQITPDDDRTYIGDPNPDFYGGFSNNILYKGFELSIFFQYSYGNDIYNDTRQSMILPSGAHNALREVTDRWTPENTDAKYPSATQSLSGVFHSGLIEDGSYLKLRTVTLAYNFPNLNVNRIGGLRVYVTGQNLLTFTEYSGFDPEVGGNGVTNYEPGEDNNTYPQPRIVTLGVRLDLN